MRVRSSKRPLVAVLIGLVAAGLLTVGLSVAAPAGAAAPLRLTFEKQSVEPVGPAYGKAGSPGTSTGT